MANNVYLPPSPVVPGTLLIANITQSNPMVVTIIDSIYNTYLPGQVVILTVPFSYGMFQANELQGRILAITSSDFVLDINSLNFDAFVIPGVTLPPSSRPASLAPGGSQNSYNITTAPFRALDGNIGN